MIHREVGKDFAVKFDTFFVYLAYKLRVSHAVHSGSGVYTLNPKCAELAFFVFTVAVSISQTFFNRVFGNGPDVSSGKEVTFGQFQNSFSSGS